MGRAWIIERGIGIFAVLGMLVLAGCDREDAQAPAATDAQPEAPKVAAAPRVEPLTGPEALSSSASSPSIAELPDVTLTDQHGEPVRLRTLLDDRIVVIQSIFTTCGGICPTMGANFGQLQTLLGERLDREVRLISISVDPITDTPERLATWAAKFDARPGWTLLTGTSDDVRAVLSALRVFTAEKEGHSPLAVVGHRDSGNWTRVDGLAGAPTLLGAVDRIAAAKPAPPEALAGAAAPLNTGARDYFTDVELTDHHGKPQRLYSDLLQGKVVVINSFFTSCQGICPPMTKTLAHLQDELGERMGRDIVFLSFSVDPITDTPEVLAAYAEKYGAGPGWLFLGGDPQEVGIALHKLGFAVEAREAHSNLFVIGNDRTGLWKKAFSMAEPAELLEVVLSVLDDPGPAPAPGPAEVAG